MIKHSSGSYQMGDVIQLTCKSGKYHGGSTNRTCMKNKYWSGTPIDCTGASLYDSSVGIELISAMKQILKKRMKYSKITDAILSNTINVGNFGGVDVYLLVDISKSITPEMLNRTLSLLFALFPELGINDGETGTRLALTFFGAKPYRVIDQHLTALEKLFKSYEEAIEKIRTYMNRKELNAITMKTGKGTAITAALDDVNWQIGNKKIRFRDGVGRNSHQVLIIISDGIFTTMGDPTDAASRLKDVFNVEIYSIAIGDLTDIEGFNTMQNLASHIANEQHFFPISNDEAVFRKVMNQMINKDSFELFCGLTKPQLTSMSNPSENRYEVDAKRNAWPWMAELRSLNGHLCGGSLIMEQWILTSAHCVFQKVSKVHLRKLKLNDQNGFEEREILQKNIYVHPEYNDKNMPKKLYDIALVKLDKRIDRIPELLPVCLWDKTIHNKAKVTYEKLFTETYGIVTGWGKRNTTSTKYAGTLKQMQMEVKSSKECLENLTPREKVHVSTELMFCAGGKEKVDDKVQNIDACEGDNGGPFVVPHPLEENKFLQIGIFSFGFGCKENGRYGFYTKLTEELLSWINSTIQKEKDIE